MSNTTMTAAAKNAIIAIVAVLATALVGNIVKAAVLGVAFAPNWILTAVTMVLCAVSAYCVTNRDGAMA